MSRREPIIIADQVINAGQSSCVKLSLAMLYSSTTIEVPVYVFHGKKDGPVLFIAAAIHGDEINGVEIMRRLHHVPQIKRLRGTLITIPIVNVYGFMLHSRYLPDRRDLNRQFPGSEHGSMASKLANLIMTEIVQHSTHGIDLHTGAIHRSNYPQVRFNPRSRRSSSMAKAFATPIIVPSSIRDGSLRYATENRNIPLIVYEAGEALRFDEFAIKLGVHGILRVIAFLGMLSPSEAKHIIRHEPAVSVAKSTFWIRASTSGMMIDGKPLGAKVSTDELLCLIVDPLGDHVERIYCPHEGIIIGKTNIPLVNEGDALFHIALFDDWKALELPTYYPEDWD
jgi:uncharacterized protein